MYYGEQRNTPQQKFSPINNNTPVQQNNNYSYANNYVPITPHDSTEFNGTTPTLIQHHDEKGNPLVPSNTWETGRDVWQNYANQKGIQIPQSGRGANSDYQEFAYDNLLDTQPGQQQLRNMWGEFGPTLKDRKEFKGYDFNNLSEQQLKNLRTNFIDSKLESRFLVPADVSYTPTQQGAPIGDKVDYNVKGLNKGNQQNNRFGDWGILPVPAIGAYQEDPLQTSQLNPHLINYRPTDNESAIAESNRGFRAITKRLGTTPNDEANVNNAFAQKWRANQETFGQDFNRKQQGKMAVDQHNAGELSRVDAANLNERNRFMDLVNRGRGVIDTQKRTDQQGALQNYYNANQYYGDRAYMQQHLGPHGNYQYVQSANSLQPQDPEADRTYKKKTDSKGNTTYEETTKEKYGGKIGKKKSILKKKK